MQIHPHIIESFACIIYMYIYIYIYIHIYVYYTYALYNRISCVQVHELLQTHCGDNREGTLFS